MNEVGKGNFKERLFSFGSLLGEERYMGKLWIGYMDEQERKRYCKEGLFHFFT